MGAVAITIIAFVVIGGISLAVLEWMDGLKEEADQEERAS